MDNKTFNSIQYFDKFNLRLLLGKKLNYLKPSKDEKIFLTHISINDWVPERILRLQKIIANKNINISNSLCVLNSLCYSLRSLNKIIGYEKNINFILKETKKLRSDWFNTDNSTKRLIELINFSIKISKNCYYKYRNFFKKNYKIKLLNNKLTDEIKYQITKNNYIIFTNDRSKILKSEKNFDNNNNIIYISSIFYSHFYELANQKNSISKIMKKNFIPFYTSKIKLNNDYQKLLNNKINLAEHNKNFLNSINIKKGLIRYGFHV